MKWVQLYDSFNILWHCPSLGLEWKLTFSSTVNRASSMPYTIWSLVSFKCYFLCFASRRLFQPFWLAHWTLPGHLLRTISLLSVWSSSSPLIQILLNLQGPDKRYFSQEAPLLSWPLEPTILLSEALDWQFTDCCCLDHCLILLLMSQGFYALSFFLDC